MNRALVLFSGGQDSATCVFWALKNFDHVETIGFDYRQRHSVELETRLQFLKVLKEKFPDLCSSLGEDHLIDAGNLSSLGETAMTEDVEIKYLENGLPNTFVPGRNIYFFTLSAAVAYRRNLGALVGGMCETDYSGYPDCRRETMDSLQSSLSLGLDTTLAIETPLMYIDKKGTWDLAFELGSTEFVDLIIENTHTCYLGDRTQKHPWGFGCGSCPACELRSKGYKAWQQEGIK